MRYFMILSSSLALIATTAFGSPVSSITCDSQMKWGFFSGNETGTLTYTANPLQISVSVAGKGEVIIDDSTHICTTTVSPEDAPFSVATGESPNDLYFTSKRADQPDGGNLTVNSDGSGRGAFSCADKRITLLNCIVK
jgi:hypothetical protein